MKEVLVRVILFIACLTTCGNAWAFQWLDGKLDVRGNIQQTANILTHEDFRDIRTSSFRSMIRGEALYECIQKPDLNVRFYVLGNYYYDSALDIDSPMRHSIRAEAGGRHKYRDFRRPRDSEEWLTEAYVDIRYKDFQIKLGKQLVSWGETAESRVADVINPLDLKYIIAFPDWEDFKLGLWMIRMYYTPQEIWQDLSFELLVIPFDFEEQRMPVAGCGFFNGAPDMGSVYQKMWDKQRRDAPSDGLKNLEIGLRIKGFANIGEGIDWAVSHFYTRLDSPLIKGEKGFNNQLRMLFDMPLKGDMYTYPHYNSTALTFVTTWNRIGTSIQGECVYNSNRDYQYGAYKIKEKDLIASALTFSKSWMVPYLSHWNRDTAYEVSLSVYQYWMLNHEYNKKTGDYIIGETGKDSTRTKLVFSCGTPFLFATLIPGVNLVYDTNGTTVISALVSYQPGDHWKWQVIYQQMNEQGAARYQNQMIFSARYEFW